MKRPLCCLCLSLCLSLSLALPAQAAKTLKFHHTGLDELSRDPLGAMGRVFKNLVETSSNGELRVTILAAGVLGPDTDVLRQVREGHIQSALLEAEALTALYPPLAALELPFALPDAPTAVAVLDGPFGRRLAMAIRQATGLMVLGFGDAEGFVQFTAPKRDMAGQQGLALPRASNGTAPQPDTAEVASAPPPAPRIGVTLPAHARLVARLGGTPVSLAPAELFPALQDGRIDGTAGTITDLAAARVGEAQKYLILADALFVPTVWVLNADFWESLTDEERLLVSRAARTALMAGRGMARSVEASERGLPALRAAMKPEVLSPQTRAALLDAALPALRASLETMTGRFPEAPALLDAFVQAARSGTELWYARTEPQTPEPPAAASPAPTPPTP